MGLIMKFLLAVFLSLSLSSASFAEDSNVAKAIILKGKIQAKYKGQVTELKKGEWIKEGTVLASSPKSFVKLLFIDKSQMSLGPQSQMAVTTFPKNKAGIITLMKGQLRSKVTKDYMDIKDKDKSKLFIKTKTAAMGVRGTDFQVNYNPRNQNTSLITFEGRVAMAQLTGRHMASLSSQRRLERIVSSPKAVMVTKGQFSGVIPGKTKHATPPVKLNPAQLNVLKKNENLQAVNKTPQKEQTAKQIAKRSVIPPGVSGKQFSNTSNSLEKELAKTAGIAEFKAPASIIDAPVAPAPEVDMGLKPGGYIDLATVNYIPPPENSVYDAATETYIPPPNFGTFDMATGEYKNEMYTLTDSGQFVANPIAPAEDGRLPASEGGLLPPPPPPPELTYVDGGTDGMLLEPTLDSINLDQLAQDTLNETETLHDESLDIINTGTRQNVNLNFSAP